MLMLYLVLSLLSHCVVTLSLYLSIDLTITPTSTDTPNSLTSLYYTNTSSNKSISGIQGSKY